MSGKVEKAGELCAAAALVRASCTSSAAPSPLSRVDARPRFSCFQVGLFDQSGARDETGAAINLISAPAFAAEREMKVTTQEVEGGVFSSLLKLTVTTPKGSHVIAGTGLAAIGPRSQPIPPRGATPSPARWSAPASGGR